MTTSRGMFNMDGTCTVLVQDFDNTGAERMAARGDCQTVEISKGAHVPVVRCLVLYLNELRVDRVSYFEHDWCYHI